MEQENYEELEMDIIPFLPAGVVETSNPDDWGEPAGGN